MQYYCTNSIECRAQGSLTGTPEVVEALGRKSGSAPVGPADQAQYSCRVVFTMRTDDERYAERLNFGLWVGSCLCEGDVAICE